VHDSDHEEWKENEHEQRVGEEREGLEDEHSLRGYMRQTRIICWSSVGRLDRVALIGLDCAEVSGTIEKRKESAVEGSEKATPMVIGHGGRANWGQPTHICALGVWRPGTVPHQPGSAMYGVR